MKICDIIAEIEKKAPTYLACDWDNVGLILGNRDAEVTTVMTALDLDIDVAEKAKQVGAQLIITHHPIMFSPVNKINSDTPEGRCIMFMIENGIALYSAHTNLDAAEGGTNDFLAKLYGLENIGVWEITYTDETGKSSGLGRAGRLPQPTVLKSLAAEIGKKLGVENIQYIGDENKLINTVSICSGGGGSMINDKITSDVYITGDVKYSNARDAVAMGLAVIIAPHYSTEIFAADILKDMISGVNVINYKNPDVFKVCECNAR